MGLLKTRFEYGDDLTGLANAAITGARVLTLATGGKGTQGKPRVQHTAADTDFVYGAAKYDQATVGGNVAINRRGTLMLLEANGAIAENAVINPAPAGRVQTDTATVGRNKIGRALHAVTTQGQMVWCVVNFPIV